jgi:hypothetical protein
MRRLHGSCSSAWAIGLLLAVASGSVVHAEPGHSFPPLTEAQRQAIRAAIPARPSLSQYDAS